MARSPPAGAKALGCLLLVTLAGVSSSQQQGRPSVRGSCYDRYKRAQRCIPEFVNAAFNVRVEATNTCGLREPTKYCPQTDVPGATKTCEVCDASVPHQAHPADYLTDFNNNDNTTWWQSETMLEGIQYPNQVNLTLNLGRAFDITYVRLKFHSMRPESFAIYKRTRPGSPWVPYQYYSSTCQDTYGLRPSLHVTPDNETRALCTGEFSGLSPLSGGSVAFSTLEGRPSAFHFEHSRLLQEWVTATAIRIVLNRLNTFGDEIFGDKQVLRSYYYAIADLAVGGRCQCNGHAMACDPGPGGDRQLLCRCEHNTAGDNCERCMDLYNDQAWGRATSTNAHECQPCNCNGRSRKCYFDQELFERTGHGGHCVNCSDNTDGPNCERCRENYYQNSDGRCMPCNCDPVGSRMLQCNSKGQCPCKPGVEGQRCDRCAPNFYDFSEDGCRLCGCSQAGSVDSPPSCNPETGVCRCKTNVEGRQCDRCKPGFFNLQRDNEFGCTPCFCFGHSAVCQSAPGYSRYSFLSTFARDKEHWKAADKQGHGVNTRHEYAAHHLAVVAPADEAVYFLAPDRYLGDQRASYNQNLTFTLRIGEEGPKSSVEDIVLEGAHGSVSQHIFGQGNGMPSIRNQEYRFRLHEDPRYGWNPTLSSREFISILSNLTAIRIRATYVARGTGFIDNIQLQSAQPSPYGSEAATWVEMCTCPEGYVGQFCESCAPGFRHDPPRGGKFSRCVPCNCNGHALICEPDTGRRCDLCFDGHYGDPQGNFGPKVPCKKCECNDNIDPNAVANCNTTTGQCLKCVYNTTGFNCERCLPGHYGDALAVPKGDCKPCDCHRLGSLEGSECDPRNGQCACKANVAGRQCAQCREGYWNLQSGDGCEACNCNLVGSYNRTCDQRTGHCHCRPGVTGKQCDQCLPYHYGFSPDGCVPCDCDSQGSVSLQCAPDGQCECRPNVEGRRCERCKENKFNKEAGCVDCPTCYNLVQDAVNEHRDKVAELARLLDNIEKNPQIVKSVDFEEKLEQVMDIVNGLWKDAKQASGTGESLAERLDELLRRIKKVQDIAGKIGLEIALAENIVEGAEHNMTSAEAVVERIKSTLTQAQKYLEEEAQNALKRALERSDRYGQQSEMMSQIARDARQLADQHEGDAGEIAHMAADALNTTQEARAIAEGALSTQDKTESEIYQLKNRMREIMDLMLRTKKMAEEAKEEVRKAYDDALRVLSDATSVQMPEIDTDELSRKAQEIIDEAGRIQKEADELLKKHAAVLERVGPQREEAEDLLAEAQRQQQITDRLLAETDAAFAKAKEAAAEGERILEEAQNTLNVLKEFDENVKASKDKARAALQRVPEIQALIEEAENKTRDARGALKDAEADANAASDTAKEAQRIAEQASQDAINVRDEADNAKTSARQLGDEAEELARKVEDTDERMRGFEEQARGDMELAKEALEKANEARTGAKQASDKVAAAAATVNEILKALANVDNVDPRRLDQLEQRLMEAEGEAERARLDERLEELRGARQQQQGWMHDYEAQIEQLKRDVANVKDISDSLPDRCFRRIKLEP
ncbi:laminin subunit gamma-1 isoform X2 [Amblyomma americanum]